MRTTIEERAAPAWTDEQLVASARGGDSEAFAAIYDRYAEALFNAAYDGSATGRSCRRRPGHLRPGQQRLEQLRDPSRLKSWLYAITTRQALRVVRARLRSTPTDEFTDIVDGSATPTSRPSGVIWPSCCARRLRAVAHRAGHPRAAPEWHEPG